MSDNIKTSFAYLADHPEFLPILADWYFTEWGHLDPQSSKESIERELLGYLNKDRIPLTVIGTRDSQPIASAILKLREVETHPQYLHWLGGVYVHPVFRGHGIGSELVEFTAAQAAKLQVADLYLYTRGNEGFYSRLGWRTIEKPVYQGRVVSIMKRRLTVSTKKGK